MTTARLTRPGSLGDLPLVRVAPFFLLVVSWSAGWVLPFVGRSGLLWSAAVGLVVAALRVVLELLHSHPRRRSDVPMCAAYGIHATATLAMVLLNPLACIYAFVGYFDGERFLPRRLMPAAVATTAVTAAIGQAGGPTGVRTVPALFALLLVVNITIAGGSLHLARRREAEVAAREEAAATLGRANQENLRLHRQLMDQAREAGVTAERARLAHEIHDTVAQGLVGIITQLESLPPIDDPAGRRRVGQATESARECLAEARRAVRALGPLHLEEADLAGAVKSVTERWSETHGVAVDLRTDGRPAAGRHDPVLLRTVQESLSNVARHAGATQVTVTLDWLDDQVRVDVHDDGRGFEPDTVTRGHGLDGMAARTAEVGGGTTIESRPGHGCTVSAWVPR